MTITAATPTEALDSSVNPSGYLDGVTFTNTLNADATGYVLFSTTNGLWSSNNLSGGVAISLSITNLPRGTNVVTATYSGDTNYLGGSITLNQVVTNHPPVANGNSYSRNGSLTWKMAISDLLTNATDMDVDTLTLASLGTSTNGVTLDTTTFPGLVAYYNPNHVDDQFSYTVTDGFGGTNTGVITLTYSSGVGVTGQINSFTVTGGVATMTFAGIPGYSYQVQRSTDLSSWSTIWTTNAPSGGLFEFNDSGAPEPNAYYRLMWQ